MCGCAVMASRMMVDFRPSGLAMMVPPLPLSWAFTVCESLSTILNAHGEALANAWSLAFQVTVPRLSSTSRGEASCARDGWRRQPSAYRTSRSVGTLRLSIWLTARPAALAFLGQQRRRLGLMEVGLDRRMQVPEHRTPLLGTRRDHRPNPLTPAVPCRAPRPLRDHTVEHHEPDGLLRQVVRRPQPRRRHEPEITLPVLLKP